MTRVSTSLNRLALTAVVALGLIASSAFAGTGATHANDYLKLIFNATPIANIADNAASSPATSLYLTLHSADPTASGNQTSNEVAYTGYSRATVARTTGGFTVSTNTVTLAATVNFPPCTAGTATATYWSVGTASSGTGKILYSGALSPSISISNGVTPQLTTGTTITIN